jgi:electron transfer flavoprotein-quinone oxidoreductase
LGPEASAPPLRANGVLARPGEAYEIAGEEGVRPDESHKRAPASWRNVDKVDVAVVGAGLAGASAAYAAAKAGAQVVLVERGARPGAKNVSGGLLYTHGLSRMFPEFWKEEPCPVERAITRNVLSLLTPTQATSLDFFDAAFGTPPFNSFSVLRAHLDPWLVGKAEAQGATPVFGSRVDGLVKEGSRVVGIRLGEEELRADVVVLAEGFNALATRSARLEEDLAPETVGIGVKQVIGLPPGELERRFQLRGIEGVQLTATGFPPGVEGGGFLYTNRDSLSLGMILNLGSVVRQEVEMYEVLEQFKQHPLIARYLEGGTLLEYSGCVVNEGGISAVPPLSGEGYLLAGSAGQMFLNTGLTLRGMDFAIESGRLAGEVAARASRKHDRSARSLAQYRELLGSSFVLRDLRTHRAYPEVFANPRLYGVYPEMLAALLHRAYFVDGTDRPHLYTVLRSIRRGRVSYLELGRDLLKAMQTL